MRIATLSTSNGFKTTAKRLIQRAPAFWKQLWDHRSDLFLSDTVGLSTDPVGADGMADNFMALLLVYAPTSLYEIRSAGFTPPSAKTSLKLTRVL